MEILFFLLFLFALSGLLTGFRYDDEEEEVKERPKLNGKDLDNWTQIYQGLSTQYQHSLYSDNTIQNWTWENWAKLTGKPEWVETNKESKDV